MACREQNESTGASWKKHVNQKARNRTKGQTAGKTKGGSCQASAQDRFMCSRNGSYKHPNYADWCESIDRKGGRKR